MKYLYFLLFSIIICSLYNCRVEADDEEIQYNIENSLTERVDIKLYVIDDEGNKMLSNEFTIDGEGILAMGKVSTDNGFNPGVTAAFKFNFAELIFNNTRLEEHFLDPVASFVPAGRSMVDSGAYLNNNGVATYTINQTNFDNAIPCDGPCK